jgi:hypothetical protein
VHPSGQVWPDTLDYGLFNPALCSRFPFFGQQALLPLIDQDSLQPVLTDNGPPDPSWYFRDTSNGSTLRNLQTDFIWAIPFKAKSSKRPSKP